jgi:hypothetical protein
MSERVRFYLEGGIDEFTADGFQAVKQKPFRCLRLINATSNYRDGGVYVRSGSMTETISGTLNRPLGIATYKADSASLLMPVNVKYLVNFAGANWRKKESGSYSSVTANANTSFSSTKQTIFAQLSTLLAIAGGKPARWDDGASEIEMMGYPAPSTAITFTSGAGGLSPQYGYTWIFTYYNSSTGKESDWSPVSASTGAATSQQFTLTLPTSSPGSSADKKRIYRTTDGGSTYYFVTDINIATASYVDNNADTALGVEAPFDGDNGLPPDESYCVVAFNGRLLWVDADDPYTVFVSKPYIGSINDLEYYPSTNRLRFDHEVVGMTITTAGLLVFGVRNISLLTGSDFNTYQIQPFKDGEGTLFPSTLRTSGETTVWLGEEGWKAMRAGRITVISDDIKTTMDSLLAKEYDNYVYASVVWNPGLAQFLCSFSASSTSGTPWIMSSGGLIEEWQLSSSGVTEAWEIPGSLTTDNLNRVFLGGWDPVTEQWHHYQMPQAPDLGPTAKAIVCMATPFPSTATFDPQQDVTLLGIDGGTNAGIIVAGFQNDLSTDDGADIDAEVITTRIVPGQQNGEFKRFRHIQFEGAVTDIASMSGGSLGYIKDTEDPHVRSYTQLALTGSGDKKTFEQGKAKWVHLRATYSGSAQNPVLLKNFTVHFVELKNVEAR